LRDFEIVDCKQSAGPFDRGKVRIERLEGGGPARVLDGGGAPAESEPV
jgi:hypothetical protein